MFDLHRHDEFSTYDGFGRAYDLAKLAKEYGHTALCSTNHGNTNGLVQTYKACKEVGIKPILGVEGYFMPVVKPQNRGTHIVILAKNLKGYGNLNKLQFYGDKQKYYNSIWDLELFRKHREGLICTSGCVASYLSKCIQAKNFQMAEKFLLELKAIFGDDFYVEIQPYVVSDEGLQETVNIESYRLAKKLGIKCVLTSDSHYGSRDDFDTYIKMHEMAAAVKGGRYDIERIKSTYGERYMPTEAEISERFIKMHGADAPKEYRIPNPFNALREMLENLDEISNKCEGFYLDDLPLELPHVTSHKGDDRTSKRILLDKVKEGLKRRGVYNKEYIERCKEEYEVVVYHGFEDYFLIVADYVNWAKENGIAVGPGRGSVCNSLLAYSLSITEVDSLYFNLSFSRFLRKDKKKYPDVDLDFQTSRRGEVIEYICEKYKGKSARICSYGLYKIDNLVNDLAGVCGLTWVGEDGKKKSNAGDIAAIKKFLNANIQGDFSTKTYQVALFDPDEILNMAEAKMYNKQYDNIIKHFLKLFMRVKYLGTHAAGVAITGGDLLDYVSMRTDKDGYTFTGYDLNDLESVNVIKFDILGLKTQESLADLRKSTGVVVDYKEAIFDENILEQFRLGNTDGVFQFETATARSVLRDISTDCFEDIVAASSMNRPGPLSQKLPAQYADKKLNGGAEQKSAYWKYTKNSYGTVIYQEQIQQLCVNIGEMKWESADKLMKMIRSGKSEIAAAMEHDERYKEMLAEWKVGAKKHGLTDQEALEMFYNMTGYTFNQGHATGYSLISVEEMYYKVYYPTHYWYAKLKYAKDEAEYSRFCSVASQDNVVIFLPHINYSGPKSRLRKVDGEYIIQQGLSEIKDVGEKASKQIVEERKANGIFLSYDNFVDRCKSGPVNVRVIRALQESGAMELNKKTYINRVVKYNSSLVARSSRR